MTAAHNWRFFRAGGFDQVLCDTAADLAALPTLDQKLWGALSCPTVGVEFDRRTLALIDQDQDGHIRAPELIAALEWAQRRLVNLDVLLCGNDYLDLAAIDQKTPEGSRLFSSARAILQHLGRSGETRIAIADAADQVAIFAESRLNGDGIITRQSVEDPELAGWIDLIIARQGAVADRSGVDGVSEEQVAGFAAAVEAWLEWSKAAPDILALAPANVSAIAELWQECAGKLDDYFVRCALSAYDPRGENLLNGGDEQLAALAMAMLSTGCSDLEQLPLARVSAAALLPLGEGINPAWQQKIARLRREIVAPLLGDRTHLGRAEWDDLKERLAPLTAWWETRVAPPLAEPGNIDWADWRCHEVHSRLVAAIAADSALHEEAAGIIEVETLARYCRDLYSLINNFVSFRDFYTRRAKGIFQAGVLYLDGRSCELCVTVNDPQRHAALAPLSRLFLVYCDCTRNGGEEKLTIAAAITAGSTDQIRPGRNGVFYDRQGRDWDATIVRIIEHPIDLRQSFWSPYRRIGRMIAEQLQKLAAALSRANEEKLAGHAVQGALAGAGAAPPPPPFDVAKFAGIFAAIGLAVGAIGTALATVATGLLRLAWWQTPLAILGVILMISGPALFIDWFKLRQRHLGPLLDANGWAVNAHARINIPFGAVLTQTAQLPAGSSLLLVDPFADKRHGWRWAILFALLAGVAGLVWFYWRQVCSG